MAEEERRNACDSIEWRLFFRGMFATLEKSDCTLPCRNAYSSSADLLWWGWMYTLLVIYKGGDHDFETTEYKECRSEGSKNDGMQSSEGTEGREERGGEQTQA